MKGRSRSTYKNGGEAEEGASETDTRDAKSGLANNLSLRWEDLRGSWGWGDHRGGLGLGGLSGGGLGGGLEGGGVGDDLGLLWWGWVVGDWDVDILAWLWEWAQVDCASGVDGLLVDGGWDNWGLDVCWDSAEWGELAGAGGDRDGGGVTWNGDS